MNADEIVGRLREYAKRCDGVHACWNEPTLAAAADLIESLQAQLAESQRRERTVVEGLHSAGCGTCIHGDKVWNEYPCKQCSVENYKFEWRGPQEAGNQKGADYENR